jgi:hypothetical protein
MITVFDKIGFSDTIYNTSKFVYKILFLISGLVVILSPIMFFFKEGWVAKMRKIILLDTFILLVLSLIYLVILTAMVDVLPGDTTMF